jgi:hypothetical protein
MSFRILKGLPPYGPLATPFPARYGRTGQEGLVVEFDDDDHGKWVGNFGPGASKYSGVHRLWDGNNVLVVNRGHAYIIDPVTRNLIMDDDWFAEDLWMVSDPDGFVVNRSGVEFFRLGSDGLVWQTRRISLDGFRDLKVSDTHLTGLADAVGAWLPFEVDLLTGRSTGGLDKGFPGANEWERLSTS